MTFTYLKKAIEQGKLKLQNGIFTADEYTAFKESTLSKMDLFLTMNRITEEQYNELVAMF